MSELYTKILKDFSELSGDYRGEVFAAELIQNGLLYDKIYFKTLSVFNRPTSKDIDSIHLDLKDDGEDQVLLELNREGLYDMLPEGIFHFKDIKNKKRDKEGILENIEKNREEERQARKFFSPFENEFFQLRLQLELKKRFLLHPDTEQSNREFFAAVFGDTSILSDQQVLALLYILPIAYKVRGDLGKIENILNIVLLYKINIEFINIYSREGHDSKGYSLGNGKLGIDSVVGSSFISSEPSYLIHIYEVKKEDLSSFFWGGSNYIVTHYACGFFFPSNSNYKIQIHLKIADRDAFLASDKNVSYLGFNSYL